MVRAFSFSALLILVFILGECLLTAAPISSQDTNTSAGLPENMPLMELRLHPVRNEAKDISFIEVQAKLINPSLKQSDTFSISAPIVYASVTGIADRIQKIEVRDTFGTVPLKTHDDPANPGGMPYYRHWQATRSVTFPVVVTYQTSPQTGIMPQGPQFSLRAHDGGFSGAGSGFLAIPENSGTQLSRVKWDLSDMDPQSKAASTFGDGDFELKGDPHALTQGYFMVGPIGMLKVPGKDNKFTGYWLGKPKFDPEKELAWAAECYAYQSKFFGSSEAAPEYRMFIRSLPAMGGFSGTALANSFLMAVPPGAGDPSVAAPRSNMAHEMQHMFTATITGPNAGPWFMEGLTEYYTHLLLRRSGLESIDAYTRFLKATLAGYYSNPHRNDTLEALSSAGFSSGVGSGSAQNVSYTKGFLYFATVDSKIRTASKGKRKLDDVILDLFEKRSRGQEFDVPALITAFQKEYGAEANTDFESIIIRGETIDPPSGAFGPGFERRAKIYQSQGKEVGGFEWVRVPAISDEQCRNW
jgi:hypothetical protein